MNTIANHFRYMIQIEGFYAIDKTNFLIFDRDIEKILNKSARDLAVKETVVQLILKNYKLL